MVELFESFWLLGPGERGRRCVSRGRDDHHIKIGQIFILFKSPSQNLSDFHSYLLSLGAIHLVRTQPGGRGVRLVNLLLVYRGKEGQKRPKIRAYYIYGPVSKLARFSESYLPRSRSER